MNIIYSSIIPVPYHQFLHLRVMIIVTIVYFHISVFNVENHIILILPLICVLHVQKGMD